MTIRLYKDETYSFKEIFEDKTGFYIRSAILDKDGKETDVEAFQRSFPNLIDVGIMGHCLHGESGLCIASGVECYQDGLNTKVKNMAFDDYKSIVDQSKGKVFQIALGGRGDFNKHESFKEIVEYTRQEGIIPNGTTSGLALSKSEVDIIKNNFGACAVSEYRSKYTRKAIALLIEAGVKTNIHFVLSNNSIDEAINKLENNSFDKGVNAIIFLLHKNIGLGSKANVLRYNDEKVKRFFELADDTKERPFKIGFDSCSTSGIVTFMKNVLPESVEPCESAKFSMYVDAQMNAMPCSFCNSDKKWYESLNEKSIQDAWNGDIFNKFRSFSNGACSSCSLNKNCMPCYAVDGLSLCGRL